MPDDGLIWLASAGNEINVRILKMMAGDAVKSRIIKYVACPAHPIISGRWAYLAGYSRLSVSKITLLIAGLNVSQDEG